MLLDFSYTFGRLRQRFKGFMKTDKSRTLDFAKFTRDHIEAGQICIRGRWSPENAVFEIIRAKASKIAEFDPTRAG
jgi:hypothetical protein